MSGVVGKHSRISCSVQEALLDDQEWSRGTPGCQGVVGGPFRMSESGREALPDVRGGWETLQDFLQCTRGLPG